MDSSIAASIAVTTAAATEAQLDSTYFVEVSEFATTTATKA